MLKNDFFGFPKVKWLHLTVEVGKCVRWSCQIFSGFNLPKIIINRLIFDKVIQKIKRWTFFGGGTDRVLQTAPDLNFQSQCSVGVILYQSRLTPPNLPANQTLSVILHGGLGWSPQWPVGPRAKPLVRVSGGEAPEADEFVILGTFLRLGWKRQPEKLKPTLVLKFMRQTDIKFVYQHTTQITQNSLKL